MLELISRRFKFALRNTSFKKELMGGLITFFAMIYILPVNSNILSHNGEILPYGGVFIATAVAAGVGSITIGMFSNIPIGVAPGMGSNIFFVSTMVKQFHLSWETSLAIVILNGLIFTVLAISGVIDKFIKSIPSSIKYAFVLGLGIYLAFIGLKGSGIATINSGGFKLGDLKQVSILLTIVGIFLIFILSIMKIKMSILFSLLVMALIGMLLGQILPNHNEKGLSSFTDINFDYSEFNQFGKVFGKGIVSIPSALTKIRTYPSLLALSFMTLSGASGTIVSVGEMAGLKDNKGNIKGSKKALIGIGISSTLSGSLGSSSAGGFLESNAGVASGAKTGFTSIIIGTLFLFSIPLYPILQPLFNHQFVTAPILIYVGSMMVGNVKKIEWSDPVISSASFILLIVMWFTSSILNGIAFGIVSYTIFKIMSGGWKEINISMYIFAVLFASYMIAIPFIF